MVTGTIDDGDTQGAGTLAYQAFLLHSKDVMLCSFLVLRAGSI